jgi:RNase P/RNase MRP subunit p30
LARFWLGFGRPNGGFDMSTQTEEADLEVEFDALARRAGIEIPPERRAALLEGFRDLRKMVAALHRPRPATSEFAEAFDVRSIIRQIP